MTALREPRTAAGRELLRSFQSPDEPFTNVVVQLGIVAIEDELITPMTDDPLRAALERIAEMGPDRAALDAASVARAALAASAPDEYGGFEGPKPGDYPEEGPVPTAVQNAWNEAGAAREPRLVELPPVDDDNHCTGCAALVKRDGSCKCRVTS